MINNNNNNNKHYKNIRIKKSNYSYVRILLLLSTFIVTIITFYLLGIAHKNVKGHNKNSNSNTNTLTTRKNLVYDILKQQKERILSDPLGAYYKRRSIYGETTNVSFSYISGYEHHRNVHIKSILTEHNITDLNDFDPFSSFFSTTLWDLYPPQVNCPDSERVGKVGDGGKWVCGIKHLTATKEKTSKTNDGIRPCVIYSFGVSTDSSFEHDMIRLTGCEIHLFDPTIGKIPPQARKYEMIKEESVKDYVGQYNSSSENAKVIDLNKIKGGVVNHERMIFHKVGLGVDSSKPHEEYYVPITLWDIMHSLNHSFVDIIKIDIEGGEWEVFSHLFSLLSIDRKGRDTNVIAPIGQVLVELHYKNMLSADKFFNSMLNMGFVSFSREINLIPCLSGGKPIASEYSFINPDTFFLDKRGSYDVPPIIANIWHDEIKAVIYYLTQKIRIPIMKISLQLLYENFWKEYPYYPVLIFHDDLDAADVEEIKRAVPLMNVVFRRIELSIPPSIRHLNIPDRTKCSAHSSTVGYRHMIQFHATRIHEELFKSEYKDTEYIFRIDDDSFLTHSVGYDMFRFMKLNQKKYGFISFLYDDALCIEGLWDHARQWANKTSPPINMTNVFFNELPDGLVAYNNFEISHSSVWKHSKWVEFINSIGESGGIYTKRWGDAPIHTLGISLILKKSEVHRFKDLGYRHDPFINQKPTGLPKPNADPFSDESVNCFFYERWICTNSTRNDTNLGENTLIRKPSWSSEDDTTNDYFHLSLQQPSNVKVVSPQVSKLFFKVELGDEYIKAPQKGVLFSFMHKGREDKLADTIKSFIVRFTSISAYPFVIFHSKRDPPDFDKIARMIGVPISDFITFVPVKLKAMLQPTSSDRSIQKLESSCISSNKEVQATSQFLRFKASSILTSLGYDWHFRFADDSRLQSNISSNIFSQLANEKKLYAYFSAIRHNSQCVKSIWELMESLCANFEIKGSAVRCSNLLQSWPRDVVIFSNFEISHRSLWDSPICKLFQEAEKTHPERSIWGDAAVHTLCLIATLEQDQIKRVTDIKYELNIGSTMQWSTDNITDSSRMIDVPSSKYQSRSLPEFDELFLPQRFGWMGGDVANSIALPNLDNADSAPNVYIWLFGDSLVGTSSGKKRLEAQFISNSVALMMLWSPADMKSKNLNNNVRQVNFYWGQDKGQPSAVFHSKKTEVKTTSSIPTVSNSDSYISYWPVSGIAVRNDASFHLLVLGQHIKHLANTDHALVESIASLSFIELSSDIFYVTNPYSPPDTWQYECLSFPETKKGRYRWISMFDPNGKSFINDSNDYLYMIGIYEAVSGTSKSSDAAFDFLSVASRSYQILSRIKVKDLIEENMSKLEIAFVSDMSTEIDQLEPHWGPVDSDSVPLTLFSPAVTELSIFLDTSGEIPIWVIISLTLLEQKIRICKSVLLYGPWTCKFVETVLEPWDDLNTFITYAAKVHVELKSKGNDNRNTSSIIISYIPNTLSGPGPLFQEGIMKEAYSPKFLEIDI